ncbi:MAG: nuclear transport factor 2 family protein [Desulfovibrionaceae bacterium]|nr:nuclear transport factor 2 family protein [Desulfovibrionaceae bacterium]
MTDSEKLELLEKFAAGWNAHDADVLMECMTPDNCVFYAAAGSGERGAEYHGPEAVRAAFEAVWQKFPDAKWNNPRHFVSGDRGATEWLFTGTSADGSQKSAAYGVDLFEFENGKIRVKDTYRKQVI